MKKDYIPLYIALGSGFFGLLTTIEDNLTKNIVIKVPAKSVNESASLLTNPKLVIFVSISVVAVLVFCLIKFKRHRINRKRK